MADNERVASSTALLPTHVERVSIEVGRQKTSARKTTPQDKEATLQCQSGQRLVTQQCREARPRLWCREPHPRDHDGRAHDGRAHDGTRCRTFGGLTSNIREKKEQKALQHKAGEAQKPQHANSRSKDDQVHVRNVSGP